MSLCNLSGCRVSFSLIPGCYAALQFRRQQHWVAIDVLQQARVSHPMKAIGMAFKDHVALVAAFVAVVFMMRRLMQVADEAKAPCGVTRITTR